jgi:hypothetical protein
MAQRKRHCKRNYDSDIEDSNDATRSIRDQDELLIAAMRELMVRSDTNIETFFNSDRSAEALANMVQDGLVSVSDGTVADHDSVPDELERSQPIRIRLKTSATDRSSLELGEHPLEARSGARVASS